MTIATRATTRPGHTFTVPGTCRGFTTLLALVLLALKSYGPAVAQGHARARLYLDGLKGVGAR